MRLDDLDSALRGHGRVAVALSGGVDSMTLAHVAHDVLGADACMWHAVSPAVPPEATLRVRDHAARHDWHIEVFDAGEFADQDYLANPANRCFFCKINLYGAIAARTPEQIVSGTNCDDLGDFRPGLDAARRHQVRHPYVEAGFDKAAVRDLARSLDLDDLAELPAAPCLASRLETGIRVRPEILRFVHAVETVLRDRLQPRTVRCRYRADGIAIELDGHSLAAMTGEAGDDHRQAVQDVLAEHGHPGPPRFEAYRMGSAFLRDTPGG